MSTALIITMGTISLTCTMIEKILVKTGKPDDAQMANIAGSSMLTMTVIGCVVKVFNELKKL